jgi:Holliday junction resolvase
MAGGSRSKQKGSGFERDVAKVFEAAFGGKFIRTANSGAFVGGLNAGRKAGLSRAQVSGQKGDLIPPDHMPRLVIEAKAYKEFRFHQLLVPGAMPQLEEWITQARECVDPGDVWIIVFKVDRRGTYVFVPDLWNTETLSYRGNHARYLVAPISGTIMDFERFLQDNRDEILKITA